MQHKDISGMQCPVARSMSSVGEWWSILILRDAFNGLTRFDEFAGSLPISSNMLARRLSTLVDSGLLERRLYHERPTRYEYVLTPAGRDFRPVLFALIAWGNRHLAPEGASVVIVDETTGAVADPVVVDRHTGRPLNEAPYIVAAGPAASERTKRRYARAAELLKASGVSAIFD